jgi:hypothetical protein
VQISRLTEDLNAALKARDQTRVDTLRMLLSELNYKKIELQKDLTEDDVLGVIKKEAKKRREAIESFKMGGRQAQADQEAAELVILEAYLPKQLSAADIKDQILGIGEIKGVTDFGQVMKIVAPKFKGVADGAMVAGVVKDILAQK